MDDEIREITIEDHEQKTEQQAFNPLEFVTIPVKEYKKLIKKVERLKRSVEKEHDEMMIYHRCP